MPIVQADRLTHIGAALLKAAGATDDVLHKIMVDNPRRFLACVPKRPRRH